jgi:hypothetical protein
VILVRTDTSEEHITSIIRVETISVVPSPLTFSTVIMEEIPSSEPSVLARTTRVQKNGVFWVVTPCGSCKNQEDTILHSHRRENLKSYTRVHITEDGVIYKAVHFRHVVRSSTHRSFFFSLSR